ncbi:hypothetical protein ABZV64_25395 [Streptomyces sp. NPDC004959]
MSDAVTPGSITPAACARAGSSAKIVVSPRFASPPGEYYENHKIARTSRQASDIALARRLWDRSAALTGV